MKFAAAARYFTDRAQVRLIIDRDADVGSQRWKKQTAVSGANRHPLSGLYLVPDRRVTRDNRLEVLVV